MLRKPDKSKDRPTKTSIKGMIADTFDLPKEIVLNMPKLTVIGNVNVFLENHKGIIEYGENRIRVNSGNGIIVIEGMNMIIDEITSENIFIRGVFKKMEFETR